MGSPTHISASPLITGEGRVLTWTLTDDMAMQLFILVTVTVYSSVLAGLTLIDAEEAPFDHKYDTPPLAVRTVVPPLQIVVSPLMIGAGRGKTVTFTVSEALQLLQSFTVTE